MRTEVEIRLLQLTRQNRRVNFRELAQHSGTEEGILAAEIASLNEKGLVSSAKGVIELDTSQRMRLAEQLIRQGRDPQKISRCLGWQEFEGFAEDSLGANGFRTVRHLVFKTRTGRREIDLLAWNDTFTLAVDCKHWSRGWSPSRVRKAAKAQIGRAVALAERFDLLRKHGVENFEKRTIMPVIFALGDPHERIVDGVPVVSVSRLMSFLYGISPLHDKFRIIPVNPQITQSTLAGYDR